MLIDSGQLLQAAKDRQKKLYAEDLDEILSYKDVEKLVHQVQGKAPKPKEAIWIFDRPHNWKCSECGTMYGESHIFIKYCSECGAKMRKE